jgi:hypothetical protein
LVRSLGRRQAVRQRILVPSCGGSNPPAPTTPQVISLPDYTKVFGHTELFKGDTSVPGH